jgi:hypothetical protein
MHNVVALLILQSIRRQDKWINNKETGNTVMLRFELILFLMAKAHFY